jgi:hypothetical protein
MTRETGKRKRKAKPAISKSAGFVPAGKPLRSAIKSGGKTMNPAIENAM